MPTSPENNAEDASPTRPSGDNFDYSYVHSPARVARYDDLRSAPRIIEVAPADTAEFIENLASTVYDQARAAGGNVPYTVVREVAENFIHARFCEVVVSILDGGNTIRFADQGPGISDKAKAQLPGFTSAVEPMKRYIRGVGSGLPIVKEYLGVSNGVVTIDDNLNSGAVVTISLSQPDETPPSRAADKAPMPPAPPLNQRERDFLGLFLSEGALGVTDLSNLSGAPASSTHGTLKKMEQAGLIERTAGQKRILTEFGYHVATSL